MTDRRELEYLANAVNAELVLDNDGYVDHVVYCDKKFSPIAFAEKVRQYVKRKLTK